MTDKLVLRTLVVDNAGTVWRNLTVADQSDPGVPIADLVREIEELWEWKREIKRRAIDGPGLLARGAIPDEYRAPLSLRRLSAAREAAAKPQFTEGQEVTVRMRVASDRHRRTAEASMIGRDDLVPVVPVADHVGIGGAVVCVPPEDVRPVED